MKNLSWKQIVTLVGILAATLGGTGYSALTADGASTQSIETQTVVKEHSRRLDTLENLARETGTKLESINKSLGRIEGALGVTEQ